MAYTPYYSGGWQSGEEGDTPITPAALNNMESGIEESSDRLDALLIRKTYSYRYTIEANASLAITGDNLGVSTPTGYIPIAVRDFNTNSGAVCVRGIMAQNTGSNSVAELRNVASGSSITRTFSVSIIYAKTDSVTFVS